MSNIKHIDQLPSFFEELKNQYESVDVKNAKFITANMADFIPEAIELRRLVKMVYESNAIEFILDIAYEMENAEFLRNKAVQRMIDYSYIEKSIACCITNGLIISIYPTLKTISTFSTSVNTEDEEKERKKLIIQFTTAISNIIIKNNKLSSPSKTNAYDHLSPVELYQLAEKYDKQKDKVLATKLFKKAAELGFADAQFRLWEIFKFCTNHQEAREWCQKAAEQGIVEAQFQLGMDYGRKEEYERALIWLKKASSQRHSEATLWLGTYYRQGWGCEKDLQKSLSYYKIEAEKGNAEAQYNVADIYEDLHQSDYDNPKYLAEAAKWHTMAAEQGNAESQWRLGWFYSAGRGVIQNPQKSAYWYAKAADQGHSFAQKDYANCLYDGIGVKQDFSKAIEYYQLSVSKIRHRESLYKLGKCYFNGTGINRDLAKAVECYQQSASDGYAEAQFELGKCYEQGVGVPQNDDLAVDWWLKAINQRHILSRVALGKNFYRRKVYNGAIEHFQEAANMDDPEAQYCLGICYQNGEGVPKDKKIATEWYEKAANQGHQEAKVALKKIKWKFW